MSVGLFGPDRLQWASGGPAKLVPVYVFVENTSNLATLYGDPNGLTTVENPTWTDHTGELTFFTNLGDYDLWANDTKVATVSIVDSTETIGVTQSELEQATRYTHVQAIAVDTWVVDHPLGYDPGGILIINSSGDIIHGGIEITIPTRQLKITLASAESGMAKFS